MKAQDLLDQNYPPRSEKRKKTQWIHARGWGFEGSLKIESFENLKSIFIGDKDLTEVEIGNCPKLEQIVLFNSSINRIIISNCDALRELEVSDGELTSLDFLKNLPTKNLTKINLMNNNISPQTLDIFIPFQNLCNLEIGCDEEGAKKGKRNNFFGSLAPLKNINNEFNNNLTLDISGTDIESGLEYISLERFNDNMYYLKCKPRRENDKVKAIFNQLDPYFKSDFHRELGEIEIDEELWKKLGLKKPKEKDEGEKIPKTPPPTDPPLAPPKIPPQKPSQEPPDNQNQNNPEPTQNLPNQPNISNNQNNNSDSKPSIFLTRSNTKKTITKLLMENNFKTTDLDDKFANWESELDKLDSEEKIKNYQTEIQQAIQNLIDKKQKEENNNNGFSLSTKIAIGVGIILIMLVSCCLVIKRIKRRK